MSEDLVDLLEQEIRSYVLATLPTDPSGHVARMPLDELLIVYGTWRSRLVSPRPRQVHLSHEFSASPKRLEHERALDAITMIIEAGGDLTPYLSRAIKVAHDPAGEQSGTLVGRKDRDLLIADWAVHHLHLSTTADPDGYVKRTGDLLFAAFTADDAYLIKIYPHGSWALKEVLEILVRNWPDAGILRKAVGLTGLSQHYTDEERLSLRTAGVALLEEIDGAVYMPPAQTTAGTPLGAAIRAQSLMTALGRLRETTGDLHGLLDEATEGRSGEGAWEPLIQDEWCGFTKGERFVPIHPLS